MIIPKEQLPEIEAAAKPLADFLLANCHPHCHFIVTAHRVELVEGIAGTPIKENRTEEANKKIKEAQQ